MVRIIRTRTLNALRDAAAAGQVDAAEAEKWFGLYMEALGAAEDISQARSDRLKGELDEARCSVDVLRELEEKVTAERDDLRDELAEAKQETQRLTERVNELVGQRDDALRDDALTAEWGPSL